MIPIYKHSSLCITNDAYVHQKMPKNYLGSLCITNDPFLKKRFPCIKIARCL